MIVSVPKNTLTDEQKLKLDEKGYVVIECDEPEKIRILNPEKTFDANDFFMAALEAIQKVSPTTYQEHFVNNLFKRLKKIEDIDMDKTAS